MRLCQPHAGSGSLASPSTRSSGSLSAGCFVLRRSAPTLTSFLPSRRGCRPPVLDGVEKWAEVCTRSASLDAHRLDASRITSTMAPRNRRPGSNRVCARDGRSKIEVSRTKPVVWRVVTLVSDRVALWPQERSRMETRSNEPGTPGTNREKGRSSQVTSNKGAIVARRHKSGAGPEEEWFSLGTDDPAFWLKEPERD